jgi:putative flippase GtrA
MSMSAGTLAGRVPHAAAFSGLARVASRHPTVGQVARFVAVGAFSTGLNAGIFLVLRTWLGPVPANLAALLLSTAVSTEANRRFTFGGVETHPWRARLQICGTVAFYACYSSGVLILLHALVAEPTHVQESLVVVAASVLGGTLRYLLLRLWVFEPDGRPVPSG